MNHPTLPVNALISVSDKTGVLELAQALAGLGVRLLSTGGTAKLLADNGLAVTEVADMTGFPEMLDGRVKTLHPKVHGGLLARRDLPTHMAALDEHGIATIDLLVVNLYPFEATIAQPGCTLEDAIENIDIGGPAMVRSAAKNWQDVVVLTDASQYSAVIAELRDSGHIGTGVIREGHLYVQNMNGIVECVELRTGKKIWKERLKGNGGKTEAWSSPVLAGDRLYVVNQGSDCFVLRASPTFEVLSHNPLDDGQTNASPAISDGNIFFRTHAHLWCIGK